MSKFIDMAAFAFQAFEMLSKNAHLNVLISLTRLVGIAGLALFVPHPTMRAWSVVYLAGSVLAALIAVVVGDDQPWPPKARSGPHSRRKFRRFCFLDWPVGADGLQRHR